MNSVTTNVQDVTRTHRGVNAMPDALWAPLCGGLLTLIPGLLGLATGNVWLFPSLGPSAYLQAAQPQEVSARPYNTLVGHACGMIAGVAAVFLLGANAEPSVFQSHHLFLGRVLASALAVALTLFLLALLKAHHPPAGATTLLITLGGFKPYPKDLLALATGVVLIAFCGEFLRRVRLSQPGQK